jgi:Uma2 family endonuclease
MSAATVPKRKLMTAEEFYVWANRPENDNRWFELVRGEVIELPVPRIRHGAVAANAVGILRNYTFKRRKGYITSNDSGVILERDPDTVRGPDVALYENVRSFDELPAKYAETPPRVAVEVLSPEDRPVVLLHKIADYLRTGVEMVWLIDPKARTITVYRSDKMPRVYQEHEVLTGEDVLPGFRCRVAEFFYLPEQEQKPRSKTTRRRRRS